MEIEVIKLIGSVVASSTITALIVGYFLNKKLEERKMILKVNEQFLSLLVTGLHSLMKDCKLLVRKAEEIQDQLAKGSLTQESINELDRLRKLYRETLSTHRIYLTALIPYGGTGPFSHAFDDVNMVAASYLLRILGLMTAQDGGGAFEKYKDWALEAIYYINVSYESVCNKANSLIAYIHEGKNPFTARWKSINSDVWEAMAEQMFERFISLDIEDMPEPPPLPVASPERRPLNLTPPRTPCP